MMLPTDFLSLIKEESEIETLTLTSSPRTLKKEKTKEKLRSGIVREFIKIYDCSPITSAKCLRRDYRHTTHDKNKIGYIREINFVSNTLVRRPYPRLRPQLMVEHRLIQNQNKTRDKPVIKSLSITPALLSHQILYLRISS